MSARGIFVGALVLASAAALESGIVRLRLRRPLGIVFEECEVGCACGVEVVRILPGSNADLDGRVQVALHRESSRRGSAILHDDSCSTRARSQVGDILRSCSAVLLGGKSALVSLGGDGTSQQFTSWERQMIPCRNLDFDTIMSALESNSGRRVHTALVRRHACV